LKRVHNVMVKGELLRKRDRPIRPLECPASPSGHRVHESHEDVRICKLTSWVRAVKQAQGLGKNAPGLTILAASPQHSAEVGEDTTEGGRVSCGAERSDRLVVEALGLVRPSYLDSGAGEPREQLTALAVAIGNECKCSSVEALGGCDV